jgi:Pyruvate/2-oxoacid:ferredoxin oxidoreductase delta subunit
MSYTILPDLCIDCGACDFCCATEAIHPPPTDVPRPAAFWIETNRCNDCGLCPKVCPMDCILPDPDTIGCVGRGCPVASDRRGPFAGWECSKLEALCDRCGHVLWRSGSRDEWVCLRCGPGDGGRRVLCPKVLSLEKGKTGQKTPRRDVEELYANRTLAAPCGDAQARTRARAAGPPAYR